MLEISSQHWLSFLACLGNLTLAVLVLLGARGSALSIPVALLCFDVFLWNFGDVAHDLSGHPGWHFLDVTASPLSAALALHVILAFVGQVRRGRFLLIGAYAFFGSISLGGAAAHVSSSLATWTQGHGWGTALTLGSLPVGAASVVLLAQHYRGTESSEERIRTRLMFLALMFGVLELLDVWEDEVRGVPSAWSNIMSFLSTGVITVVVVRLRLFGSRIPSGLFVYSALLGMLGVAAYLLVFSLTDPGVSLRILGAASITLLLTVAFREVYQRFARYRKELEKQAVAGQLCLQLMHDLRTPLAVLKGAAQYLSFEDTGEQKPGADNTDRNAYLGAIVEHVDRVERLLGKYQRLAEIEPALQPLDLGALLQRRDVLQANALGRKLTTHVATNLPTLRADPDLLEAALDNLVQNAVDATEPGAEIAVRAYLRESAKAAVLEVTDSGEGISPRELERVTDPYFSTKPDGSGLGLPFVDRIARAHGGKLELFSEPGKRTIARLILPLPAGE